MTFNNFTLEKMKRDADGQFNSLKVQLSSFDKRLDDRLDGKSRIGLIAAVVVTLIWAAVYIVGFAVTSEFLPINYCLIAVLCSLILALVVIIDDFVKLKYYGKIIKAKKAVAQLTNRVNLGKNNLAVNGKIYQDKISAGWEMPLGVGASIKRDIQDSERKISELESLSGGFINGLKNVFYYVVGVAWTAIGSYSLFGLIEELVDGAIEDETLQIIMIVAVVIACIGEIILSRVVWGATDDNVNNVTLLTTVAGPLVFALLIAAVVLVVFLIQIVLAIAAVVIGGAFVIGSLCGG